MKPFGTEEKLGEKTIAGVVAEGTRRSYKVSSVDPNAKPIVVVHGSWYCSKLRIVVLATNDDLRSGS